MGDLVNAASDPKRLHDYLYALVQHFTGKGVTSMLVLEVAPSTDDQRFDPGHGDGQFSYMSDNIILLSAGRAARHLSIVKARATRHDLGAREVEITEAGIGVRRHAGSER